jgi:hypothetical protein
MSKLRDHRHSTLGRTTLDEWSARFLPDNTHHSQQADIHAPVGFETAIPTSERPKTQALDRAAIGIGWNNINFARFQGLAVK